MRVTLLSTLFVAMSAPAQEDRPAAVRIRAIGDADGLPRPGVHVYVAREADEQPGVTADGFVIAEDARLRRLRGAIAVRTDPEGRAEIAPVPLWSLAPFVSVGEPHALARPVEALGNELVLRVVDHEPVGVRVVDGNGRKVAGFAVALRAADQDLCIALSDADGQALLGLPRGFTARVAVVPAGWVGPLDGFPTLAEALAGRRSVVLTVPPHGRLRLRAVRGGQPPALPIAVSLPVLHDLRTWQQLHPSLSHGGMEGLGVEFPFVALGVAATAHVTFDSCPRRFEVQGPRGPGECAVADVELGLRPQIRFRLGGLDPGLFAVRVAIVTDARTHADTVSFVQRHCEIERRDGLHGTRLRRLDFDCAQPARGDEPAVVWTATVACDRPLTEPVIDLGEIRLEPHPPQLRGRVVDAAEAPVAGARVVIAPPAGSGGQVESGADGRFQWLGPLFRDGRGAPALLVAWAGRGEARSETSAPTGPGGEVTLVLRPEAGARAAARHAAKGTLVARIANVAADRSHGVSVVGSDNSPRQPSAVRAGTDGHAEFVFEGLRAGRYMLCAIEPGVGRFPVLEGLEVPGDGACTDERLRSVGLFDRVTFVPVLVVDAQGVPIAGAMVTAGAFAGRTDGTGRVRVPQQRDGDSGASFEAAGSRPLRVAALTDGRRVQLDPAGTIAVTVRGIPADLPRERLEVWVRDEVRERFAGPKASLGAGDVTRLPLPARGRYLVWLLVTTRDGRGGETSTGIATGPSPFAIGDEREQAAELALDEAAVAQLREALGQPR